MSQISEPSEPSALDGALVPYAEDLGSAIATIQHVMERLQVLGAQLDSGIELEGASLTPAGMSSTPEHHTVSVGSAPVTASDNVSASAPRWYAVLVGCQPGVFCGAHSITSNTDRIPGSNVPRCDTEAEAQLNDEG
ncbi:hypothetical protein BDN70DRAFT_938744 [Pholiota conissans]|uniref:Uncharacterized protein n=1 Tax=Pholiota conissans TaxID=109636 RepID=A0A9P5YMT6_9AGAR|nr:hypothetical protein BDN70DRAFT_938744 [Pholiota conissans]